MQGKVRMKLSWLKLDIGIYDDQKIKVIRKMPAGAELFMMWIGLLCLGMRGKTPGVIELDDGIPYSIDDLSNHFDLSHKTVQLALQTFSRLKMIDVSTGGTIEIINFRKHQSLENIEYQRERNRINVQKHREKQALLKNEQVKIAPVTDYTITGNRIDLDIDIDRDKEEDKEVVATQPKHKKQRTIAKHLQLLKDTYRAANNNDPFISEGHAIAISKHWASMGEEKYTMAAKQWAITKKDDGMPHPVGYFAHDPDQYYQKAKATRPVPKVDLDRLMLNVQSAIEAFKREVAMGDIVHAQRSWDYINKYPELRDKYNFKDVRP